MLDDSFDWDHDDELSTPETFAEAYCADLGLGGEFVPLVAHAIHEQVYLDRKVSASALPRGPSSAAPLNSVVTAPFRLPLPHVSLPLLACQPSYRPSLTPRL